MIARPCSPQTSLTARPATSTSTRGRGGARRAGRRPTAQLVATLIHGQLIFGEISTPKLFADPVTGKPFTPGTLGDRIIELAACWGLVMTLTGYYLFFKGRKARLRRVAAGAKGAVMRHRHGLIGAIAGLSILHARRLRVALGGLVGGQGSSTGHGHRLGLLSEPGCDLHAG